MAFPAPTGGAVTGANLGSITTTGYSSDSTLSPAIQQIWSKEILFQAMPVLRFEQFAVKKTELGVMPGLTVNFMRYNNLSVDANGSELVEGVRMEPSALSASQIQITVKEQGKAVAVTELLLNASFDDVMASSSRLLGRHMAQSMDVQARNTLYSNGVPFGGGAAVAPSVIFGRKTNGTTRGSIAPYEYSAAGSASAPGYLSPATIKDAVEVLAGQNIPRLGDTYVCFVHPAQARSLRDWPEFIEVTKYAAPGNFMLGEIGRIYDVVFIETTQVARGSLDARFPFGAVAGSGTIDVDPSTAGVQDPSAESYSAMMIGDNAFGQAIALPVELRDGGVIDFGREHGLSWYAIWGFGVLTHESRVLINTKGGAIDANF
jgi:N4-gp56 family major capsid protein